MSLDGVIFAFKAGTALGLLAVSLANWEVGSAALIVILVGIFTLRLQMFRLVRDDRDEWKARYESVLARLDERTDKLHKAQDRITELEAKPDLGELLELMRTLVTEVGAISAPPKEES